jgi:hypothetical protein
MLKIFDSMTGYEEGSVMDVEPFDFTIVVMLIVLFLCRILANLSGGAKPKSVSLQFVVLHDTHCSKSSCVCSGI